MILKYLNFTIIILSALLIVIFSCTSRKEAKKNNQEKIFEIEIEYKILKDDIFQVFYIDQDSKEKFSEEKMISKKINKSQKTNSISFNLPKEVIPKKIRIDLGENKCQEEITINQIKLKYSGNEIIVKEKYIPHFFVMNSFLKYDPSSGEFRSISINNRYDPFIISSALLNQKIKLEL